MNEPLWHYARRAGESPVYEVHSSLLAHRVFMTEESPTTEWNSPQKDLEDKIRQEAEKVRAKKVENITKIFNQIFQRFRPAQTLSEADMYLSTTEIFNQVMEHYPNDVLSTDLIYELMQGSDYVFTTFENKLEFIWLFKNR